MEGKIYLRRYPFHQPRQQECLSSSLKALELVTEAPAGFSFDGLGLASFSFNVTNFSALCLYVVDCQSSSSVACLSF